MFLFERKRELTISRMVEEIPSLSWIFMKLPHFSIGVTHASNDPRSEVG